MAQENLANRDWRGGDPAGAAALSVAGPNWRPGFPSSDLALPPNRNLHTLSVVHYATATERCPAHIRSDAGSFATWRLTQDPEIRRRVDFANQSRLEEVDARRLFHQFSSTVCATPAHKILERIGGVTSRDGCADLTERSPFNTEIQIVAAYDARWMERMFADEYTFYMMRREDRATFVNPHLATDPMGVLLRQGYTLTPHPKEWDVVLYCSQPKADGYVDTQHWGVVRGNGVVSKNTSGSVAFHTIDAGGFPGQSILFFTKPMNELAPVADLYGIKDWVKRGYAVVSRSAEERADAEKSRRQAVIEREDELLAQTCFGR